MFLNSAMEIRPILMVDFEIKIFYRIEKQQSLKCFKLIFSKPGEITFPLEI